MQVPLFAYLSQSGALSKDGRPLALAAMHADNRCFDALTQEAAQALAASKCGVDIMGASTGAGDPCVAVQPCQRPTAVDSLHPHEDRAGGAELDLRGWVRQNIGNNPLRQGRTRQLLPDAIPLPQVCTKAEIVTALARTHHL